MYLEMKLVHLVASIVAAVPLAAGSSLAASLDSEQQALVPTIDSTTEPHTSILAPSLREELLGLHKHIVEIESLSGNELKVGQWLEKYLLNKGFSVERQKVAEGRYNVYAWGGDENEKGKEEVLVSSHIDTVPPFIPYSIDADETTIAGRGSVDAKGSVAAQITAVLSLFDESKIPRSSIGLLYVVGEEVDAAGMHFFSSSSLNKKNYTAVVFGEPTEQKLCAGHKGNYRLGINVQGRASHSGYPWLGLSANDILIRSLSVVKEMEAGKIGGLPSDDKFGNTTVNIGRMSGGVAANVVAESATAELLFRVAASTPKDIAASIEDALKPIIEFTEKNGGNFTLDTGFKGSVPVELNCDIDGFECFIVNYGTDIPHLELSKDTKRYLYGPGSILVAHGANEAIKVADLEQAVVDYKKIISGIFEKKAQSGRVEL